MNSIMDMQIKAFIPGAIAILLGLVAAVAALVVLRRKNFFSRTNSSDDLYFKIRDEIRSSVTPHFVQLSPDTESIVELAIEIWRIEQRVAKAESVLSENLRKGMDNSILKMRRYLGKYDVEIIDYAGQKYNDGLNLEILSVEKDSSVSERMIKETVEPAITCRGRVIKKSKVVLISNEI